MAGSPTGGLGRAGDRTVSRSSIWHGPFVAAVLSTAALALLVAALIGRAPPDFTGRAVIAVLRDGAQNPVWAIRLAPPAHQIAVDTLRSPSIPEGRAYQLWLVAPGADIARPLGLLPLSGRKIIAETPANTRLLAAGGELRVTREPAVSTLAGSPSGPVLFRGVIGQHD